MNSKIIKIIGTIATVLGAGATLVTAWAEDQKKNIKIEEAVDRALSERENEDNKEEEET